MKSTTIFFYSQCGNEFSKWSGKCPSCREWNTLTAADSLINTPNSSKKHNTTPIQPTSIKQALKTAAQISLSTNIAEFDQVLGKGLTIGGTYLLAGSPGVGKSTLLSQLAISANSPVFYICSEENSTQVAFRLNRLKYTSKKDLYLFDTSNIEQIISTLKKNSPLNKKSPKPVLLIIDSIQSIYTNNNPTSPGSPTQVRDCANLLIQTTKKLNLITFLVGQITKQGQIAGPKLLEHMVDTVIDFSGDKKGQLRILKTTKNRFGPTDEVGVFEMTQQGLKQVTNISSYFISQHNSPAPGSSLALIIKGSRTMTIEIQALINHSPLPIPRRIAKSIKIAQLQLICAIIGKHLKIKLSNKDIFVNIAEGLNINTPDTDLSLALAIISAAKNKPLPKNSIAFGELDLLGDIRPLSFHQKRLKTARKLGYKNIINSNSHKNIKQLLNLF